MLWPHQKILLKSFRSFQEVRTFKESLIARLASLQGKICKEFELFSESHITTKGTHVRLFQPCEVHKSLLAYTGLGRLPLTQPPITCSHPLASEASKSILLSSRNLSSTGRSFKVVAATFRINPSFQLPHLRGRNEIRHWCWVGPALPVGSGGVRRQDSG